MSTGFAVFVIALGMYIFGYLVGRREESRSKSKRKESQPDQHDWPEELWRKGEDDRMMAAVMESLIEQDAPESVSGYSIVSKIMKTRRVETLTMPLADVEAARVANRRREAAADIEQRLGKGAADKYLTGALELSKEAIDLARIYCRCTEPSFSTCRCAARFQEALNAAKREGMEEGRRRIATA